MSACRSTKAEVAWPILALLSALVMNLPAASADAGFDAADLSPYVFVANRTSGSIAIVDTASDRVISSFDLGSIPDQYVVSQDAGKLAAINSDARRLSLLDLGGGQVVSLDLAFRPDRIQLHPDGGLVVVSGAAAGTIVFVSLTSAAEVGRVETLARPADMIFDRAGETLFVANGARGQVTLIDVASLRISGTLKLTHPNADAPGRDAGGIVDLLRTPGGQLGFALHGGHISVIDLRERQQITTIALPGRAERGFVTANSQYILVPDADGDRVSKISTWTYDISARLPGAADVSGINTGMFDSVAYVLSRSGRKAVLLDLLEDRKIGEIELPLQPATGISAQAGTKLYVALAGGSELAVFNMRNNSLQRFVGPVGEDPWGVSSVNGLSYCH